MLCHQQTHLQHAVLHPELPSACSLSVPQLSTSASSVPPGGDRPFFPTVVLIQAVQEMSETVLLSGCLSAAREKAQVSWKGSTCALKPDPEFPLCFITLTNRGLNPVLGSRLSGKWGRICLCSRYEAYGFKPHELCRAVGLGRGTGN